MSKNLYPYSRQYVDQSDIQEVIKVLKSDTIARGNEIMKFENNIKKFVGSKYAISANSATSALHLACLSLGLKKNDLVWSVPNTFVASTNCALHCGAKIDFVDIDIDTGNIDVKKLKNKLTFPKKIPKVLITVDFAGQPTDQEEIFKISRKFGFNIIEDASHALGASRNNEKVGSCKWSDATVFSFHPVKIITTGEGGAITTNSKKIFEKLKIFRNHGITKDIKQMKKKISQKWYYEQLELGYNFWMSDINAALGNSQIKKVKNFTRKRNAVAKYYFSELKNLPIILPKIKKGNTSSYHLFIIRLLKKYKNKYKIIFNELLKKKLNINLHYLPVHLHPFYKKLGFKKNDYPAAELHADTAISIPIYYNLKKKEQKKIINIIKSVIKKHVF